MLWWGLRDALGILDKSSCLQSVRENNSFRYKRYNGNVLDEDIENFKNILNHKLKESLEQINNYYEDKGYSKNFVWSFDI